MVIDTGGFVSVISRPFYERLMHKSKLKDYHHNLIALGQTDIGNGGSLDATVELGSFRTKFRFEIVDDTDEVVILGANFVKFFDGEIIEKGKVMKLGKHLIPLTVTTENTDYESRLILVDDIILGPGEEISCRVVVEEGPITSGCFLMDPSADFQGRFEVMSPRVMVEMLNGQTDLWISISNLDNRPKRLSKDSIVGRVVSLKFENDLEEGNRINSTSVPTEYAHLDKIQLGQNLTGDEKQQIRQLLEKYADVFSRNEYDVGRTNLIPYEIDTGDATPIKQRVRQVPPHKREAFKQIIDDFVLKGFLSPSLSPWASPVVLVSKKSQDGEEKIRFCCDYRKLNERVRPCAYPLPQPNKVLEVLQGAKVFSSLDFCHGYFQIELDERDREKTAICTPFGLYQFNVLPQGLSLSSGIFQRTIDHIMSGLTYECCLSFIDDLLVYAGDINDHLNKLEQVLLRVRGANLKLRPEKCSLFCNEVKYLGHKIGEQGISTDDDKIKTIRDWTPPKCVKEVRSFLGLASYYRKYVNSFSTIAAPINNLLRKDVKFVWDDDCQLAFETLKNLLISAPILAFPDINVPFILDVDSSGHGIGAVLSQKQNGQEKPVAFASRTLNKAERNYSVTRRELLAVVEFTDYFRSYLLGSKFTVRSDHGSLRWLKNFKNPEGQVARWIERLSEFDMVLEYREGSRHKNADALSRVWCPDCQSDKFLNDNLPFSDPPVRVSRFQATESNRLDLDELMEYSIGRLLSFHLRHNQNLLFRDDGYIQVGNLMLNTPLIDYRLGDIVTVAENNERFEVKIENEKCWIRARYGHSINFPQLYNEHEDYPLPKILVHRTNSKYWPKIQNQGIKRMGRVYVHLSGMGARDPETSPKKDLDIHVDVDKLLSLGSRIYRCSEKVFVCDRDIPPDCILRVVVGPQTGYLNRIVNRSITSLQELVQAQHDDPSIGPILRAKQNSDERPRWEDIGPGSREMKSYWVQWDSLEIRDNLIYRKFVHPKIERLSRMQLLTPRVERKVIWEALHSEQMGGGHYGYQKSLDKVRERYYWFGMTSDIDLWCKHCLECQRVKSPVQGHRAPLHPIPCSFPNERIQIDIVDPRVFTRKRNRWILTVQDSFTKWFEAFPLKSMRIPEIANILISQYFCRFGIPLQIHSDMGQNFESKLLKELGKKLGFHKSRTTFAHPEANGMIERSHKVMTQMLRQYVDCSGRDWDQALPYIGLAYRSTVHDSTGFTPNLLTLGKEINLPIHLLYGNVVEDRRSPCDYVEEQLNLMNDAFEVVRDNIGVAQKHYKESYDKKVHGPNYVEGDKVWLYVPFVKPGFPRKFHKYWEGPYIIVKKLNDQTYVIKSCRALGGNVTKVVHYNKLKLYLELPVSDREGTNSRTSESSSQGSNNETDMSQQYNLNVNANIFVPGHLVDSSSSDVNSERNGHVDGPSSVTGAVTGGSVRESSKTNLGNVSDSVAVVAGSSGVRTNEHLASAGSSEGLTGISVASSGQGFEPRTSTPASWWPNSESRSGFSGFDSDNILQVSPSSNVNVDLDDVSSTVGNVDDVEIRDLLDALPAEVQELYGSDFEEAAPQCRRSGRNRRPPDRYGF